jgi:hypothetical protein
LRRGDAPRYVEPKAIWEGKMALKIALEAEEVSNRPWSDVDKTAPR